MRPEIYFIVSFLEIYWRFKNIQEETWFKVVSFKAIKGLSL